MVSGGNTKVQSRQRGVSVSGAGCEPEALQITAVAPFAVYTQGVNCTRRGRECFEGRTEASSSRGVEKAGYDSGHCSAVHTVHRPAGKPCLRAMHAFIYGSRCAWHAVARLALLLPYERSIFCN